MKSGLITICDPEQNSREHLRKILEPRGHQVTLFGSAPPMVEAMEESRELLPDLILLADTPGEAEGIETLRLLRSRYPQLPVVLISGCATIRGAIAAMKMGAVDFLVRPVMAEPLLDMVHALIERNRLEDENRSLKAELRKKFDPEQIIFRSKAFKKVFDLAKKVAPSSASVLVQGESGTGKELIASTIHYSSRRRDRRFLTINCAALTDTLLESQLFGHQKGSFTGAVSNQRGLVEEADGGSLFLDEIGDISPSLQAKLLRVLQEKEFLPIGSTRVRHADVRFIAATNKDLEQEVAAGRFREDLFFRLNVVTLLTPPLRERKEDIPPLAEYFISRFARRPGQSLTSDALSLMRAYHWPGNVRELENVIEMAIILADGEDITPEHLPVKIAEGRPVDFALPQQQMALEDVERLYIEQVYRQTHFHKVKTAEILKISRKTLDRKLTLFNITRDQ